MTAWIDDLRKLADAATPGPRTAKISSVDYAIYRNEVWLGSLARAEDARLYSALSPESIKAMLAVIEAADAMESAPNNIRRDAYRRARAALDEAFHD